MGLFYTTFAPSPSPEKKEETLFKQLMGAVLGRKYKVSSDQWINVEEVLKANDAKHAGEPGYVATYPFLFNGFHNLLMGGGSEFSFQVPKSSGMADFLSDLIANFNNFLSLSGVTDTLAYAINPNLPPNAGGMEMVQLTINFDKGSPATVRAGLLEWGKRNNPDLSTNSPRSAVLVREAIGWYAEFYRFQDAESRKAVASGKERVPFFMVLPDQYRDWVMGQLMQNGKSNFEAKQRADELRDALTTPMAPMAAPLIANLFPPSEVLVPGTGMVKPLFELLGQGFESLSRSDVLPKEHTILISQLTARADCLNKNDPRGAEALAPTIQSQIKHEPALAWMLLAASTLYDWTDPNATNKNAPIPQLEVALSFQLQTDPSQIAKLLAAGFTVAGEYIIKSQANMAEVAESDIANLGNKLKTSVESQPGPGDVYGIEKREFLPVFIPGPQNVEQALRVINGCLSNLGQKLHNPPGSRELDTRNIEIEFVGVPAGRTKARQGKKDPNWMLEDPNFRQSLINSGAGIRESDIDLAIRNPAELERTNYAAYERITRERNRVMVNALGDILYNGDPGGGKAGLRHYEIVGNLPAEPKPGELFTDPVTGYQFKVKLKGAERDPKTGQRANWVLLHNLAANGTLRPMVTATVEALTTGHQEAELRKLDDAVDKLDASKMVFGIPSPTHGAVRTTLWVLVNQMPGDSQPPNAIPLNDAVQEMLRNADNLPSGVDAAKYAAFMIRLIGTRDAATGLYSGGLLQNVWMRRIADRTPIEVKGAVALDPVTGRPTDSTVESFFYCPSGNESQVTNWTRTRKIGSGPEATENASHPQVELLVNHRQVLIDWASNFSLAARLNPLPPEIPMGQDFAIPTHLDLKASAPHPEQSGGVPPIVVPVTGDPKFKIRYAIYTKQGWKVAEGFADSDGVIRGNTSQFHIDPDKLQANGIQETEQPNSRSIQQTRVKNADGTYVDVQTTTTQLTWKQEYVVFVQAYEVPLPGEEYKPMLNTSLRGIGFPQRLTKDVTRDLGTLLTIRDGREVSAAVVVQPAEVAVKADLQPLPTHFVKTGEIDERPTKLVFHDRADEDPQFKNPAYAAAHGVRWMVDPDRSEMIVTAEVPGKDLSKVGRANVWKPEHLGPDGQMVPAGPDPIRLLASEVDVNLAAVGARRAPNGEWQFYLIPPNPRYRADGSIENIILLQAEPAEGDTRQLYDVDPSSGEKVWAGTAIQRHSIRKSGWVFDSWQTDVRVMDLVNADAARLAKSQPPRYSEFIIHETTDEYGALNSQGYTPRAPDQSPAEGREYGQHNFRVLYSNYTITAQIDDRPSNERWKKFSGDIQRELSKPLYPAFDEYRAPPAPPGVEALGAGCYLISSGRSRSLNDPATQHSVFFHPVEDAPALKVTPPPATLPVRRDNGQVLELPVIGILYNPDTQIAEYDVLYAGAYGGERPKLVEPKGTLTPNGALYFVPRFGPDGLSNPIYFDMTRAPTSVEFKRMKMRRTPP